MRVTLECKRNRSGERQGLVGNFVRVREGGFGAWDDDREPGTYTWVDDEPDVLESLECF